MPNDIMIIGEIGDFGVSAIEVVNQIQGFDENDEIVVNISSEGGDIAQGLAIYNALVDRPGRVIVNITGVALSMASGIAMAGDVVNAAENAIFMMHEPQSFASGDESEMRTRADMLATAREAILVGYVNKSGLSRSRIEAMVRDETWLTAQEAKNLGFVDSVGPPVTVNAKLKLASNLKVPTEFVARMANFVDVSSSDEGTTNQEKDDMADKSDKSPTDAVDSPATLDELLNLSGADNDFAVDQMKAKATLTQAQNALNSILLKRLEAAEAEAEKAKNDAKKQDEKKKSGEPTDTGHDPVPNGEDTDAGQNWANPRATFDKLLSEARQRYPDNVVAMRMVDRNNPGLIDAMRSPITRK